MVIIGVFNRLCRLVAIHEKKTVLVGVDPLASSKGFWAEVLGVGDFYYELGIVIVQVHHAFRLDRSYRWRDTATNCSSRSLSWLHVAVATMFAFRYVGVPANSANEWRHHRVGRTGGSRPQFWSTDQTTSVSRRREKSDYQASSML